MCFDFMPRVLLRGSRATPIMLSDCFSPMLLQENLSVGAIWMCCCDQKQTFLNTALKSTEKSRIPTDAPKIIVIVWFD